MTSLLEQVIVDVQDIKTTDSITLCCLVVLLYDLLITFPKEVKYIWKARWTWGKVLFIINRYTVLGVSAVLAVGLFDGSLSLKFCRVTDLMDGWSMLVLVVPVQLILCLRTTALWERSRKVICFLVVITLASDGVIATFIWLEYHGVKFESGKAAQEFVGCYADESSSSSKLIIPAVAALIIFDTAIFFLTVVRVGRYKRAGALEGRGRIVNLFFRDGLVYYLVMLISSLANLAMYAAMPPNRSALVGSVLPVLRTTMSVCTNRLVLNLRGIIDQARLSRWEGSKLTGGSIHSFRHERASRRLSRASFRTVHTVTTVSNLPEFQLTSEMRDAIVLRETRRVKDSV